jgi:ABC-type dipeptide/oligopeptide/nickel transport system permease subunit
LAGLGLIIVALLILPILGGIVAGLFFLSVPRLRFVSPYSALIPLFSASGLIVGFIGGLRLARPYFYRFEYGLSTSEWPAWALTVAVTLVGAALGMTSAVFAARGINRRRAANSQ